MKFRAEFGEVYCDDKNVPITNPSLLISPSEDMLFAWGDAENVNKKYQKFAISKTNGFLDDVCVITLNYRNAFSPEEIAYILWRAVNFTATGFVRDFYSHFSDGSIKSWLENETKRIPME